MPLESLLGLVETLRSRIDEHGNALRQSEALTRYTLIDPLLRELGWDTDDPALVMPETGQRICRLRTAQRRQTRGNGGSQEIRDAIARCCLAGNRILHRRWDRIFRRY